MAIRPVMQVIINNVTLALCAIFALHIAALVPSPALAASSAGEFMNTGAALYEKGDFGQAVTPLAEAARLYGEAGDTAKEIEALTGLARTYQSSGRYAKAREVLEKEALPLATKSGKPGLEAMVLGSLGSCLLAEGQMDQAQAHLSSALALLPEDAKAEGGNNALKATLLNDLGNLYTIKADYKEAVTAYTKSASLAGSAQRAKALANAAAAYRLDGKHQESANALSNAFQAVQNTPDSHNKAFLLINLGRSFLRLTAEGKGDSLEPAYRAYHMAQSVARTIGDAAALSYALGYTGELYEGQKRFDEALDLTRQAVFEAQKAQSLQSLYLWQWQTGRLLRALGRVDQAIAAYKQAVQTLDGIRGTLAAGCTLCIGDSFNSSMEPIYFGLADLMLEKSSQAKDVKEAEHFLHEARDTVELMKTAELRDYFKDACVDAYQTKTTKLDSVAPHTAILYAISFPERLELLVSLPEGMKRYTVQVNSKDFAAEAAALRTFLEKRTTRQYTSPATKLYDLLIRPVEEDLKAAQVQTIVFVPDRTLRNIPMAALYDGKNFLIGRYALATTLGLTLTDPRKIKTQGTGMLIAGLSEPVKDFPALVNVPGEIKGINEVFKSKTLQDKTFVVPSVRKELEGTPYSIVHIATHGEFSGDSTKTYLLTWDGKLTMDNLDEFIKASRYRKDPVELLTLSACQTAAGDDRAALGLAGVSIKAGARSALASLWSVNDQATSELVIEFYRQMEKASSRAEALRQAQLKLMSDPRYRHPYFWSPFLLIGNWL